MAERSCGQCKKPIDPPNDFCSKECADAHYKAIGDLIDGTTVGKLRARIAALEADCARLREDAERYRWLRSLTWGITQQTLIGERWSVMFSLKNPAGTVDAAIDAAQGEKT